MKIKTSELIGAALDWAAAKAEGKDLVFFNDWFRQNGFDRGFPDSQIDQHLAWQTNFKDQWVLLEEFIHQPQHGEAETLKRARNIEGYSADPSQAWPIINRENIRLTPQGDGTWGAEHPGDFTGEWDTNEVYGPTSLIAAMRCYVASKLGEEVDIPEELLC